LREALLIRDSGQIDAVDADVDVRRKLAERVTCLLEGGTAAAGNVEVATFGCERARHRETDPLARSGDERALPLQPEVHRNPPSATRAFGAAPHQISGICEEQ